MEIKSFEFSELGRDAVKQETKGRDWPVVYLINNNKSLYIGETCNMYARFGQHLVGKRKHRLKNVHVIFDDEFNKSASLDIEQSLIRLYSADQKFALLNGNAGQSAKHNYFQREKYLNKLGGTSTEKGIWAYLSELGLTSQSYNDIINSDLFTYSPYTALTAEQEEVVYHALDNIIDGLLKRKAGGTTCVITGSAGTGKTIIAVYIMQILANANRQRIDVYRDTSDDSIDLKIKVLHRLHEYIKKYGSLTIGYVLPMSSIRMTLKSVFSKTKNGLTSNMVIGPTQVLDGYDVLLVDETHRMPKGKGISWLGTFNQICRELNMDPEKANTLDWVMAKSRNRILFYDSDQSIKAADITPEEFEASIAKSNTIKRYRLETQMRCHGGQSYVEYLNQVFDCGVTSASKIENYNIRVYDDPNEMINAIKELNATYGLCRNVAGYSWKWKSKGKKPEEIKAQGVYDIQFGEQTYCWNMSNKEWILRADSINEIGCVHTVQGYDLNYVGVIFGKEIDYSPELNKIVIYPNKFYDTNVKKGVSYDELKTYIINAYKVMMERGIYGCYVYACNPNLRQYLSKCFNDVGENNQ